MRVLAQRSKVGLESMGGPMQVRSFIFLGVLLVYSSLQLSLGLGLITRQSWATRTPGFILATVALLSVPLGTALGGYTLWVLIQMRKQGIVIGRGSTSDSAPNH